MRISLRLSAAAVLAALVPALALPAASAEPGAAAAPIRTGPAPLRLATDDGIPGQYLVTLHSMPDGGVSIFAGNFKIKPLYVYGSAMLGFAAQLSQSQVSLLRQSTLVSEVEQDQRVQVSPEERAARQPAAADRTAASWGLDRIAERQLTGPVTAVKADGHSVTSYIIDSGIDFSHPEFGGRAVLGSDQINDGRNGVDCNGHGTHVAGTVGGATTGVAKKTKLVAVRVFDCTGESANSTIIAGIDWVTANAKKPAVANLSLGGPYSNAVNASLNAQADKEVFPAVAAGNSNANTCLVSPASARGAFTVAATDQQDRKAPFSNWSNCVDINAPGVDIHSAYLGGGYEDLSGTSMASPHVAGIAALYKDTFGDKSTAAVANWLLDNATPGIPADAVLGTPQLLSYTGGL
jgi:subtilisin family serine protease